jgi:hypothetical protein
VRLSAGWRGLLPQRAGAGWRPLVSVCADAPGCHAGATHEVQLGCDAQNPNLKAPFQIAVGERARLCIQVWQLPQTKKKSKKRTLVAAHVLDVGLALRRFGPAARASLRSYPTPAMRLTLASTELELPLHASGAKPARVRGQRAAASVLIKLCAPADWASTSRRPADDEIAPSPTDVFCAPFSAHTPSLHLTVL